MECQSLLDEGAAHRERPAAAAVAPALTKVLTAHSATTMQVAATLLAAAQMEPALHAAAAAWLEAEQPDSTELQQRAAAFLLQLPPLPLRLSLPPVLSLLYR